MSQEIKDLLEGLDSVSDDLKDAEKAVLLEELKSQFDFYLQARDAALDAEEVNVEVDGYDPETPDDQVTVSVNDTQFEAIDEAINSFDLSDPEDDEARRVFVHRESEQKSPVEIWAELREDQLTQLVILTGADSVEDAIDSLIGTGWDQNALNLAPEAL